VQLRLREGPDIPAAEATRRDFLSLVGFGVGAAALAACRSPVQHALPLTTATDRLVPGVANWFATTCGGCPSACTLLVKQRDGRPIKIEGNEESTLFGGGTCATGQATVLSLYDDERLRGPQWRGRPISWKEIDGHVAAALDEAHQTHRKIVLLSATITSPSTRQIFAEYGRKFPTFHHVVYDTMSLSAMRIANQECFHRPVIPHYAFDRARVVVGLEADFLGTWLSPVEFARQFSRARRPGNPPCTYIQCESGLSITGSNADERLRVAPSDLGALAVAILCRVAVRAGAGVDLETCDPVDPVKLDDVADLLWKHRSESLVVSGSNEVAVQIVVNAINALLGNIGRTLDLSQPSLQRQGDDAAMASLVDDMSRGEVHALLLYGVNPAYDYPQSERFVRGLERVPLSVSFADRRDETGEHVHALCPDHHFLESWGDAEPVASHLSLSQPTIAPLFDTRAAPESLMRWIGSDSDHYAYLRSYWQAHVFPRQEPTESFDAFWDRTLERGIVALADSPAAPASSLRPGWREAAKSIVEENQQARAGRCADCYELHLYESVALRDGRHANNPWLQELPDPVAKVTWGNFAAVAPRLAQTLGVVTGDVVSIRTDAAEIEIPVLVQPGQEDRTISIALGYGRRRVGKAGQGVGVNAYPLGTITRGHRSHAAKNIVVHKTGRHEPLARTQTHFSTEGRSIAEELDDSSNPSEKVESGEPLANLWGEWPKGDHSWGMAIDLHACIGCSACVVACQAENNVPVVGKEQVQKNRIMHWVRIDHYHVGSEEEPRSLYQPMMCQHCQHAPCETVCPVLATTTSSEGLNQQVYNRCIGTRYCANNCPYKVRKFNWYDFSDKSRFDFNMASPVGRMVLNPDVTVRSRGVMEKCSLCVQRIQLAKNGALKAKMPLVDGDIRTACEQACPTQAIVFGDLQDRKSRLSLLSRGDRAYQVLEELGTRPNVSYLKKVRHARGL
jgi:molybdopterin-containing oxidoreductase family iron-sulfur binding subunit